MADRRHVLQAGVLLASAAVGGTACSQDQVAPSTPLPTPDAQQADELALIAVYDQAIAGAQGRALAEYRRIRDEHAQHLRALGWIQPAPTASARSAGRPTRRQLRAAERQAARLRGIAAMDEADTDRAQILALIAASESQHAVSLGAL